MVDRVERPRPRSWWNILMGILSAMAMFIAILALFAFLIKNYQDNEYVLQKLKRLERRTELILHSVELNVLEKLDRLERRTELILHSVELNRLPSSTAPHYSFSLRTEPIFEMVMTSALQDGKPRIVTDEFSRQRDSRAIAHFTWKNVLGRHLLVLKWYQPSGDFYFRYESVYLWTESNKTAWAWIDLSKQLPLGTWRVEAILDGSLIAEKTFTLVE